MAKASAVAARQAHAVQSMDERLSNLEEKVDAILQAVGVGSVEGVESDAFGTLHTAIDDDQVSILVEAVKQLSEKAGVELMPFDMTDPIPHIIGQMALVADRFNVPVSAPTAPVLPVADPAKFDQAEGAKPSGKNK